MNAHQRRVRRRAERRAAITAGIGDAVAHAAASAAFQREARAWIALADIDPRPGMAAAYRGRAHQAAVQSALSAAQSIKAIAGMEMAR